MRLCMSQGLSASDRLQVVQLSSRRSRVSERVAIQTCLIVA